MATVGTDRESWWQRRRRKLACTYGAALRPLRALREPAVGLFCDCEGHFAGPRGEEFADPGLSRLLEILKRTGCRITFNVVADLCRSHPTRIERIRSAGHEIACHGWRHERPRSLTASGLDEMLRAALAAFAAIGVHPVGFRSPESAWSVDLVRRLPRHGFRWNAERDRCRRPYRIGPDLVRLSVSTDDWDLADRTGSANSILAKWRQKTAEVRPRGGVVCIGVHEWIVGMDPIFAEGLECWLHELCSEKSASLDTLGGIVGRCLNLTAADRPVDSPANRQRPVADP